MIDKRLQREAEKQREIEEELASEQRVRDQLSAMKGYSNNHDNIIVGKARAYSPTHPSYHNLNQYESRKPLT